MADFFTLLKGNSIEPNMTFNLDSIEVHISNENSGIRLITEDENWFIPRQTLEETKTILQKNFKIIKDHFAEKAGSVITQSDLNTVCLKIALSFFKCIIIGDQCINGRQVGI